MPRKNKEQVQPLRRGFRREAVRRSEDPNTTAVEVVRELGIYPGQIYNWRRQYSRLSEKQFCSVNGVDYSQQESEEVRRLKRQIVDIKEENEFLKKATDGWPPQTSAKKNGEVSIHCEHAQSYAVVKLCRWLGISPSGYSSVPIVRVRGSIDDWMRSAS
jgi:transposase